MKERPVLFSATMVRAILDGSKTQTRRIMKPQPEPWSAGMSLPGYCASPMSAFLEGAPIFCCPHGRIGDQLWVRETWGVISHSFDEAGNLTGWIPDRPATPIRELKFGNGYYSGHAIYAADGPQEWCEDDTSTMEPKSCWKPSIHMPRAISRIQLEIVGVRVERLNDTSRKDAIAEGVHWTKCPSRQTEESFTAQKIAHQMGMSAHYTAEIDYVGGFKSLWESINGAGSWDANPWVWVVEFKRVGGAK